VYSRDQNGSRDGSKLVIIRAGWPPVELRGQADKAFVRLYDVFWPVYPLRSALLAAIFGIIGGALLFRRSREDKADC